MALLPGNQAIVMLHGEHTLLPGNLVVVALDGKHVLMPGNQVVVAFHGKLPSNQAAVILQAIPSPSSLDPWMLLNTYSPGLAWASGGGMLLLGYTVPSFPPEIDGLT